MGCWRHKLASPNWKSNECIFWYKVIQTASENNSVFQTNKAEEKKLCRKTRQRSTKGFRNSLSVNICALYCFITTIAEIGLVGSHDVIKMSRTESEKSREVIMTNKRFSLLNILAKIKENIQSILCFLTYIPLLFWKLMKSFLKCPVLKNNHH